MEADLDWLSLRDDFEIFVALDLDLLLRLFLLLGLGEVDFKVSAIDFFPEIFES